MEDLEYFGVDIDRWRGASWLGLVHPDDRGQAYIRAWMAREGEQP
jgi:hypothetical protein